MAKRIVFLSLIFCLLWLFQTSLLVNLPLAWAWPSLILVIFILINLRESQTATAGFWLALPVGLLLDLTSDRPLGFFVILLSGFSLLTKIFIKRYLR